MEEPRYTYRLVSIANYAILACLVTGFLYTNISIISMSTLFYALAVFLFSQIIAIQDTSRIKKKRILRIFPLASLCLGYIYVMNTGSSALPLFYVFTLWVAITAGRRITPALLLWVIVEFLGLDYLFKAGFDFNNVIFSIIHSVLIFIVGMITQHMLYMFEFEQRQHKKIEELLRQMECNYQQMCESAQRDGLTGLYNHKAFFEYMARIDIHQTAVIMLDIDFFKSFNDRYGHLCGDYVLQEIAQIIKNSVRIGDEVFRYGEEEFAIILQNISTSDLAVIALRIRKNVEDNIFIYDDQVLSKLTVSIGYAMGGMECSSAKKLVHNADMSLYMAKDSGRNVVCSNGRMLVGA